MTTTTISGLELLRSRMGGAIAGQLPGHIERLGWSAGQLAAFQRDRLRALLARAIECSPFHAERLRGIDPRRFELADLPELPVMTKAQMMADFNQALFTGATPRRPVPRSSRAIRPGSWRPGRRGAPAVVAGGRSNRR